MQLREGFALRSALRNLRHAAARKHNNHCMLRRLHTNGTNQLKRSSIAR
jgi:hypothetical protein